MIARRHATGNLKVHGLGRVAAWFGQPHHDAAPLDKRERIGNLQLGQRTVEPRHVFFEAKGLAAVDGDDFIDAVAENETTVEHADLCVPEGGVLAVEVAERGGESGSKRVHAGIMVVRARSGSGQPRRPRFANVTDRVVGQAGFLLIINGFVKFTADNASGIPMTTSAPVSEIDAEVSDFKPLTAEEAQRLREKNPEMSPWWVIGAQVAMGILVAGVAWMWTQRPGAAVSAFYGAMAVAIPAALFVRGVRRARGAVSQSAVMLRFFVWELIKIALTVALLAAAPWLIEGISWLALLAGVVVAMKMYWVALLVRPGLLNRI